MMASATRDNLRRLCVIRALFISALTLAFWWAHFHLEVLLNTSLIGSIIAINILVIIASLLRLKTQTPVTPIELFGQLLFDIFSLSLLLFFSGGATNPFVSYYLLPLSIAAATLPWVYTWSILILCLLAYSTLLFFYVPLADLYPQIRVQGNAYQMAQLHVIGMWLNFVFSALLITIFVVRMAGALRLNQQQLAKNREQQLLNEQLMAVATLAAGTAHEMGTPLSTMKTLLRELLEEHREQPDLSADLNCLIQQVETCKHSLQQLMKQGRQSHPHPSYATTVLRQLKDRWQLMRPQNTLIQQPTDLPENLQLLSDTALEQALMNLMNNAADESSHIELHLCHQQSRLVITIRDFGRGISALEAEQLGTPFFSAKKEGMGIGFTLSQATIERFGGDVKLYNHPDQGTITKISLPCLPLEPDNGN